MAAGGAQAPYQVAVTIAPNGINFETGATVMHLYLYLEPTPIFMLPSGGPLSGGTTIPPGRNRPTTRPAHGREPCTLPVRAQRARGGHECKLSGRLWRALLRQPTHDAVHDRCGQGSAGCAERPAVRARGAWASVQVLRAAGAQRHLADRRTGGWWFARDALRPWL